MSAAQAVDRRGMIAKIHVAKKQLALEDDSYRALLRRITGRDSVAAMDPTDLDRVLGEFKRLGWKAVGRMSEKPHVRKVFAEWGNFRDIVEHWDKSALRAFVKRQTGMDDPEFLSPHQANQVIEGLKAWRKRVALQRAAQ